MEELSWDLSHQACYYDAAAFVLPHLAVLCARLSSEDKAFLIKEIGLAIGYGTLTKTACSGVELLSNKESFSMNENGNEALAQAQEMLAESGRLDITARRKLWQAMGALEVREQDSSILRTLTGPLKKRARLALVCAKKVMPIWCKCDSEDKRPQGFIKKSFAYLDGEIAAEAAAAAWKAAIVALEDESNLEPWCQVTEEEMDSYDWDAAKNACVAWSDAYTDGDNGKCAVREMKFWAWYLEEAAGLLGVEDYRFPQKYIKAFQEKQNPPKPIPGEITLESFAKFLDLGEYVYHYKVEKKDNEDYGYYSMYVRRKEDFGICPICGKKVYKVRQDGMNRRLDWYDNAFPTKEPQLSIIQFDLVFYCPGHPKEIIYSPSSGYKNVKAAVKRYIKGEGRLSKLLNELKHRKTTKYLNICGNFIVINGENSKLLRQSRKTRQSLDWRIRAGLTWKIKFLGWN